MWHIRAASASHEAHWARLLVGAISARIRTAMALVAFRLSLMLALATLVACSDGSDAFTRYEMPAPAPATTLVPSVLLHNGVQMPAIACGTGGDNNNSAQVTVRAALSAGFTHIDTAHDYNDQAGVGRAIHLFQQPARQPLFLTSKVPGCGVPTQGLMPPCFNNTLKAVEEDLLLLNYTSATSTSAGVDLMLVHFPPLLGCIEANCAHMQQQWAALEVSLGKLRACSHRAVTCHVCLSAINPKTLIA